MFRLPVLFLIILGCACNPKPPAPANTLTFSKPEKEILIKGLSRPWSMAFLSEDEVLLSEKDGDLLRISISEGKKTVIKGFPEDRFDSLLFEKSKFKPTSFPFSLPDST
ncbi:MAG: hypothetical protein AB3N14_08550, partial [Flavobacteriaceae bacterium]